MVLFVMIFKRWISNAPLFCCCKPEIYDRYYRYRFRNIDFIRFNYFYRIFSPLGGFFLRSTIEGLFF